MKKIGILAIALLIGLGTWAHASTSLRQAQDNGSATAGKGDEKTSKKEVKAEGFTAIEATSAIEVIVTMGSTEGVVFEASEEALPKLKAEVKQGELRLYIDGEIRNAGTLKAFVSAKTLNSLEVSGAASIKIKDPLTVDKMNVDASGAGCITLELTAKHVCIDATGAAQVQIKGSAKTLKVSATGAASVKAEDLKAESVDVTASGAGNAKVNVSDNLNANATGAGNVTYIGDPKKSQVNAKNAGSVNKKG